MPENRHDLEARSGRIKSSTERKKMRELEIGPAASMDNYFEIRHMDTLVDEVEKEEDETSDDDKRIAELEADLAEKREKKEEEERNTKDEAEDE